MKTTRSVALLGFVLLSCLSDIVIAQQWASCSSYSLSGKTRLPCPRDYKPVCGTNSVTYPNECSLCKEILMSISRNQAINKKHDGRCVKLDCTGYLRSGSGRVNPCTMEYRPICGTNGVTYRNKCNFCNAVANGLDINLRNVGECFQTQIDWNGHKDDDTLCTAQYDPVCGSDGKTYSNSCQLSKAIERSGGTLFLRHRGEC